MQFLGAVIHIVPVAVVVLIVVEIARGVTDELIKTALGRARTFGKADVPFSEAAGGIFRRRFFKNLRNQNLLVTQPDPVVSRHARELIHQAVALSDATGQQASPRHRAGRGCRVEIGKARALRSQAI